MAGKVAVGIILPESNGATDLSTENWSAARINTVISEIQAAMTWWNVQNPGGGLSFYYDIHTQVPTSYEPISRSSNEDERWMSQALSSLGYTNPGWSTQAYDYINAMRTNLGTDWCVLIFVVDSLNDADGKFTDGYFGYTYGYTIVMTYDNDGWGIGNMDSVTAHEFAHNFGAADEYCSPGYACCYGSGQVGYLGIANANCEAGCDNNGNGVCDGNDSGSTNCNNCPTCVQVSCLMRNGSVSSGLDTPTRHQVGMRDTDGDGIQDPIDTIPALTLTAYTPDPTSDNTPTWTGSITDIPWDSPTYSDVSINYITAVRYRVDGGAWADCAPGNGAFNETTETFSCTPAALPDGTHTIEVQATNRAGNLSNIAIDTLVVDTHLPPAGFQKTRPANSGAGFSTHTHLWWEASPDAASYEFCIDTVNNTTCEGEWTSTGEAHHAEVNGLHPNTVYSWQVRARNPNACTSADGGDWWSFTTGSGAVSILLVDDDDNSPDVRSAYTGALTALNLPYHVWDTNRSDAEPGQADLSDYKTAIWFTGENWDGSTGPGLGGEASLAAWLDTGKCLLISSRDYYYNRGLTSFMADYLGVATVGGDAGNYTSVTGQGPFSGLGPYALTSNTYADTINPSAGSVTGWRDNNGNSAGVAFDSSVYHTSFLGFQFEAIENAADRQAALARFLESCPSGGFNKTSPSDGFVGNATTMTITWEASSEAAGYEYCINTSETCNDEWTSAGTDTSTVLSGLSPLTTYYWQVRARNAWGEIYSNSDTWWRFTVGIPLYLPLVVR